ncbi:MAG: hypothetical protein ACI4Q6_05125 [Huintestinicola sp.]
MIILDIIARLWSETGFPALFITLITLVAAEAIYERGMDRDE